MAVGAPAQAGLAFLGSAEHAQTPQDSDLTSRMGARGVTALPKYIGEPRRRREEHRRGVPGSRAGTKLEVCHY